MKRLCMLEECKEYESCENAAKKNYLAWKKAYKENRKSVLKRLSEGGI